MKQTIVQVKFEYEKYDALKRYAGKKEVSIETELQDTLERLYKKLVPAEVREYIEESDRLAQEKMKKTKSVKESRTTDGKTEIMEHTPPV